MKWKPIDTAPKDGTSILVLNNDKYVYEARYDEDSWNKCKWKFASADQHGCGCCSGDDDEPTHWMPLPQMPKEAAHE
ncbi:hypothetical protein PAECIP111893_02410 [Paenibacillus plantiphilus]|uniref:DUF551 domain-containing protein n=1 Tax=Paenibacillus plantiphilus TaxID=2905650 RepID=A0ABN8GEV4_9BACL|nr:DUF551 domain-containing protein [Paenibacillus plantiphilus]CAH1205756.1 hypothetical protein PAECIP111893_02410 [Paenibacillus plantiphilus]